MPQPSQRTIIVPSAGKIARLGAAPPTQQQDSVLVVDDSRALRELLCSYLNQIGGLFIAQAGSMSEALALTDQDPGRFFCAVLDLNLPDAPNGELVELIQARGIPVIVLTGSLDENIRASMLAREVIDYVVKANATEIEHCAYIVGRLRENRAAKILVVDDSRAFRDYLQALLARYRFKVLQAGNGREALTVINEHPDITLVITDIHMPEMDGIELISAIRGHYRREDLAIIGFSQASTPGMSARIIKSGANDFLVKPFEVEEFYCRVLQNTNAVHYVRQIRDNAMRDFLTGVYNRRYLFEVGELLYANASRGQYGLATAILDADHFKKINDTFGHHAGDIALKSIAATVQATLRESDVVARYGGEEFVCMSIVKGPQDADDLFERMRVALESLDLQVAGQRIPVTVSIGVTTHLGESLHAMLRRADDGVYAAKQAGRNCVVRN